MVYEYLGVLLVIATMGILRKSRWRYCFYIVFLASFSFYYNYFIIGMLVSDIYVHIDLKEKMKKMAWLKAMMIVIGFYLLSMTIVSDKNKLSRIIFGSGIVIFMLGTLSSKFMNWLLGNKIMLRGGKISYSAYIVHWPIIEVITCNSFLVLYDKINSYDIIVFVLFCITFMSTIAISEILTFCIEPIGSTIFKHFAINVGDNGGNLA